MCKAKKYLAAVVPSASPDQLVPRSMTKTSSRCRFSREGKMLHHLATLAAPQFNDGSMLGYARIASYPARLHTCPRNENMDSSTQKPHVKYLHVCSIRPMLLWSEKLHVLDRTFRYTTMVDFLVVRLGESDGTSCVSDRVTGRVC